MKSNVLFHIISLFFPARCPVCDKIVQRQGFLCNECSKTVERVKSPCHGCGLPKAQCRCSSDKFNLLVTAPFLYKDKLAAAIQRFKFSDERELADFFGAEVAAAISASFGDVTFDLVTCVPQTKKKRRERGYNQSALLAKVVANRLGLEFNASLLTKCRETRDQHSLKAKERIQNLKGAFSVVKKSAVQEKTVLLCDDIKTTGATLNECRKTLLKAGAKAVYCAVIAAVPGKITGE